MVTCTLFSADCCNENKVKNIEDQLMNVVLEFAWTKAEIQPRKRVGLTA